MALGEYRSGGVPGQGGADVGYQSPNTMGGYVWQDNGEGGVNYYKTIDTGTATKRVPVTREEFAQQTGQDPGAIEGWVTQQFGTTSPVPGFNDAQSNTPVDTSGGTGDGTGGSTATTPELKTYKGITYDLNNVTDRAAFYKIMSGDIDTELSKTLAAGNLSYAKQLIDTQDQMDQYMHDWNAQGKTLGEGYNQGITARQQFFQGLGGRAYQSAMGTSGQNALNELGKAQTERNYQKGLAENQNTQAKSALETAFNDWQNNLATTAQTNKDTLNTDMSNIQGSQFNAPAQPVLSGQADLTPYTDVTNFNQLATSPAMTSQQKALPNQPAMTLAQYLQQLQPGVTNPLDEVLKGRSYV